MLDSEKEIWDDIDATLDQLIANASAMKRALSSDLLVHEVESLQKTQESLLARLAHRHGLLQGKKKKSAPEETRAESAQKKIAYYGKTHARLLAEVSKRLAPPKAHKSRLSSSKN